MTRLSAAYGMRYGAVAAFREPSGLRSHGLFYRHDRDHEEAELEQLARFIARRHRGADGDQAGCPHQADRPWLQRERGRDQAAAA